MRSRLAAIATASFAVLFLFFGYGCGDDTAGGESTPCSLDDDCPLGTVCNPEGKCIEAECQFCTPDQICYKPTPDSDGTCSKPECTTDDDCDTGSCRNGQCGTGGCVSNDDCGDDEICNLAGQCVESDGTCAGDADCPDGQVCKDESCVEGCSADEQCADDEYCDTEEKACAVGCRDSMACPSGQVCTDGECACNDSSCPDGKVCLDTGNCGDPTSCDQVTCPMGEVCNPATLMCQPACTPADCEANEICNDQTGLCEVNNCPGEDPNQCMGNPERNLWDPIKCFCAECLGDADCNAGAGETCSSGGSCFVCQETCDPNTPGTCQGETPYCIEECCVECVGAADCGDGELCLDGFCGQPPNCMVDPTVCPQGYDCVNGECQPPGNPACDPNDPTTCPDGTFCDPASGMCQGAGGGFMCGFCNPDCTCPNGLTCDGFFCSGCDTPFEQGDCPDGQICGAPLIDLCVPLGF